MNPCAGETRSVLRPEYLLHTPDAFVRTPLPCVNRGVAIVHASPRLGAEFLQYTAELETGGSILPTEDQRFLWVLDGALEVALQPDSLPAALGPAEFLYLPQSSAATIFARVSNAPSRHRKKVSDPRRRTRAGGRSSGREADLVAVPLGGDPNVTVKSLLPQDPAFDFAVNTMTYAPGASLAQVEVHHMEHGLLMLEGQGTYRLGDDRHSVQAGDFIWMAPYCPQWFMAEGETSAKYLIYKDWNRSPSL